MNRLTWTSRWTLAKQENARLCLWIKTRICDLLILFHTHTHISKVTQIYKHAQEESRWFHLEIEPRTFMPVMLR